MKQLFFVLTLLFVSIFASALKTEADSPQSVLSGYVTSTKVCIFHNLPKGNYQLSVHHSVGDTLPNDDDVYTVIEFNGTGFTQKMCIDNMNKRPFARAIITNKEGQIIWHKLRTPQSRR